jgi:hypothetical protein
VLNSITDVVMKKKTDGGWVFHRAIERKKVGRKLIFLQWKTFFFPSPFPRQLSFIFDGIQAHFPTHNFIRLVVPPHRNSPSFEPNHLSLPFESSSELLFPTVDTRRGSTRENAVRREVARSTKIIRNYSPPSLQIHHISRCVCFEASLAD